MPLTPIKDIRRQELLKAAFEIIKRHGLAAASVSRIAEEAGTSKGIVHHYFKNKEQLIEQAVRYAHAKRSEDLVSRLAKAHAPSERLSAVLSVLLDEKYLQFGFCRAWISFYPEVYSNEQMARLYRAIHRRECSNLAHALLPFLPRAEAMKVALGIKAMVEGIRFMCGARLGFDTRVHIIQVTEFLKRKVPGFDRSAAVRWPAPR
jgi:TetR/AcrR family transcriptional repressor of bet genes